MKSNTAVMLGALGLAGVTILILAKKAKAEEPPYPPDEEEPTIPSLPGAEYFPSRSISSNQVQEIWVMPIDIYSARFEVHNPITQTAMGSSVGFSPDLEANRWLFNYLKDLTTLSDADAGSLGSLVVLFGFK